MDYLLQEPIEQYLTAKNSPFANNSLAHKFRHQYPAILNSFITDKNRYKIIGSPGKGNWTDCPWIAILDILITETPQSGYYPVFLFKADMSGVYLSLNQGVTEVKENYKRDAKSVLKLRASDYRALLGLKEKNIVEIDLQSSTTNAQLYEAGNITAKYYPSSNLPSSVQLKKDIAFFMSLYQDLIVVDPHLNEAIPLTALEKKQLRLHYRIERNSSLSQKVKRLKGYTCEICTFNFEEKYGELGKNFIEVHHLTPVSSLTIGKYLISLENDFAVLCSNCHSMVHRMNDSSDIKGLKNLL